MNRFFLVIRNFVTVGKKSHDITNYVAACVTELVQFVQCLSLTISLIS